jgi:hypothetical protein
VTVSLYNAPALNVVCKKARCVCNFGAKAKCFPSDPIGCDGHTCPVS